MEEKGTKKLQGMKEYDFTDKWVPSENYSSLQSHFLFEQHVIKFQNEEMTYGELHLLQ